MSDLLPSTTQANYWDTLRVWWAFIWRSALCATAVGFVIGTITGLVTTVSGGEVVLPIMVMLIFPLSFALMMWSLRYALNKKYGDFKIAIIRD